jgi:hypothetical protein
MRENMDKKPISVLKPELVSKGLSVCQIKSGEIVISAHRGEQHIVFELSEQEFADFSEKLHKLCEQFREGPGVIG